MSEEKQRGFFENIFDGLIEEVAKHINQRLREVTPQVIDWFFDLLKHKGIEGYEAFKQNYEASKGKRVSALSENSPDNSLANLSVALEKYKSDMSVKESRQELIEAVSVEIADNYEMWEELSLFTQEIKCPHCGEIILENWYDYLAGESSNERNMGTEILYSIECDDYPCPKCKRPFTVEGFICTYPDGIYDSHKLKTSIAI